MSPTDRQLDAIEHFRSIPDVHRLDVVECEGGDNAINAHMWQGETLIAVATIEEGGDWGMHTPSDEESSTIMQIPEEL